MNQTKRSFSFLTELLLCLVFFTVASIGCVTIFYHAHSLNQQANLLTLSTIEINNIVERLSSGESTTLKQFDDFTIKVNVLKSKDTLNEYLIEAIDSKGEIIQSLSISLLNQGEQK